MYSFVDLCSAQQWSPSFISMLWFIFICSSTHQNNEVTTVSSLWPQTPPHTPTLSCLPGSCSTDFLMNSRYQLCSEEDCVSAEAHQRHHPRPGHRKHEDPHHHHLQELQHGFQNRGRVHWRSAGGGRSNLPGVFMNTRADMCGHAYRPLNAVDIKYHCSLYKFASLCVFNLECLREVDPPTAVISVL